MIQMVSVVMAVRTKPVATVGSSNRVVGVDSVFGVGIGGSSGSRGSSGNGQEGRKSNEELHFGWID